MTLGNDLDLPFEPEPDGRAVLHTSEGYMFAGGVVIMAAVTTTTEDGDQPALVYRFAKPDGSGFYPDMILILTPDQFDPGLVKLTSDAVAAALASTSS